VLRLTINGVPVAVAEDRRWLAAFDRDAPAQVTMTAHMADGRKARFPLTVAAGNWRIEHINAPMRGAARSSEEFQRRRAAELEQIAQARTVEVQSDGWRQSFIWPVTGRFSGFFGSQRIYQGVAGSYHSGTDIAVPRGTPFVAPADGVVVLAAAAPFTLEGNLLIISHGMGLNSAFLHCDRLDVKLGDVVKQGQHLGTVGSTGRSTGPHMHWGMKWGDSRVDPGAFVAL
jgi:murein DD-endopeptidase MepM/ murein hydrolase activator NlpD